MMKDIDRGFTIKNYYLAEIDQVGNEEYRSNIDRWSWDIYIAANENSEYQGKAVAPGKGIEVPWTPLAGQDYLEEMMGICQQQMTN
jgi:hypothetical protein